MITLDTMGKLALQQRHMDIIEEQLLDALDQLKKMRQEHENIMIMIVEETNE